MNETRQSTEKRFSEAASENKKKRGRPTVYKRDHMEGIGRDLEIFDGRTHRTHVNQYYRAAVFGILEEHKEISETLLLPGKERDEIWQSPDSGRSTET